MEPQGKAIPFIAFSDREGFKVTEEAKEFLKTLEGKIGIISVAGKYRTGKSYLLNRILLDLKPKQGFGVGPTINPCTKGLWVWTDPVEVETYDGEMIKVLLIDSEGLGAFDEDQNHDTRIFLLALLLSSWFIYNSQGAIDEAALQNLSLIVNLSKELQIRSTEGEPDEDELSNYFPSFLWILRDFALQLKDMNGNKITVKTYLENALLPAKGLSDTVEQKNRIRRLLKHFFKERDAFAFVRPLEDERGLQNLETMDTSQLRPEFVSQVQQLRKIAFRKVRPKMLNGHNINGEMFLGLAEAYTQAINTGSVPSIEGAWTYVCKNECEKTMNNCVQLYETKMREALGDGPIDPEKIKELNREFKDEITFTFKDEALGQNTAEFEKELRTLMTEKHAEIKKSNNKKVAQNCDKFFEEKSHDFLDKLKNNEYTQFHQFKRDLEEANKEFGESGPKGEVAIVKLKEFTEKMMSEAADYINRNATMESKNNERRLTQQLDVSQIALAQKHAEQQEEREKWTERINEVESERHRLRAQESMYKTRHEEVQSELQRVESNYTERIKTLKEDNKERINDFKNRYDEARKELNELRDSSSKQIAWLSQEKALLAQEVEFRKQECEKFQRQRDESDRVIASLKEKVKELEESQGSAPQVVQQAPPVVQPVTVAPQSMIMENDFMRKQVESLTQQLADQRAIQDTLRSALESKITIEPQKHSVAEANKHLARMLDKMEDRCQFLEEKLERMKKYQRMVQNANTMQCKMCRKTWSSNVFSAHLSVCMRSNPRGNEESQGMYNITVNQVVSSDYHEDKMTTEYNINVSKGGQFWEVKRNFRAFLTLKDSLKTSFPQLGLPAFTNSNSSSGSIFATAKPKVAEERKKMLEQYLNDLTQISAVLDNQQFKGFLNIYDVEGSPEPDSHMWRIDNY